MIVTVLILCYSNNYVCIYSLLIIYLTWALSRRLTSFPHVPYALIIVWFLSQNCSWMALPA